MSHKLKPTDLTNLLLKPENHFPWEPASNRILRYDNFVNELAARYAIVHWGSSTGESDRAKCDLFLLCSGSGLRTMISGILAEREDITFEDLTFTVRQKLFKDSPPLLMLAKLLSLSQLFGEPFEKFFDRVIEEGKSVDWDSFTSGNIRNIILAATLGRGSPNPYVKGHCSSVRDLNSIKLDDLLITAQEYEEKMPQRPLFPSTNKPSSFGQPVSHQNGCTTSGLFGTASKQVPIKCGGYMEAGSFGAGRCFAPASSETFGGESSQSRKSGGLFGFGAGAPMNPEQGFGASAPKNPEQGHSPEPILEVTVTKTSFEEDRNPLFGYTNPNFVQPANANPQLAGNGLRTSSTPFGSRPNIFMSKIKDEEPSKSSSKSESEAPEKAAAPGVKRQRSNSSDKA